MKKENKKGVESTCASTTAENNIEKNIVVMNSEWRAMLPLAIKECKLLKLFGSMVMACYKISLWGDSTDFWLCGRFEILNKGTKYEEFLRDCKTFINGGGKQLAEIIRIPHSEEEVQAINEECATFWNDFKKKNEEDICDYLRMYKELKTISFDEPQYVGLDVWETKKGIRFSLSGSTWILGFDNKKGLCFSIDSFMLENLKVFQTA